MWHVAMLSISLVCVLKHGVHGEGVDASSGDIKIVGGDYASKGEFPATVCLRSYARCGGTLVKMDTIITAAHCLWDPSQKKVEASTVRVIAGALNINDPSEEGYQETTLSSYKTHEKFWFKGQMGGYDIAIGHLAKAFTLSAMVKPATYAAGTTQGIKDAMYQIIEDDTTCVGLGWGLTAKPEEGGKLSEKLKMVQMRVLPQRECRTEPGMENSEICVVTRISSEQGIAEGDSGTTFSCQGNFFGLNKQIFKHNIGSKVYEGAAITVIWPYVDYFGLELNLGTCHIPDHTLNIVVLLYGFVTIFN